MSKVLKADGTWYEGKASPELLREDLRKMPSDWVTKDPAEIDKIHRVDPPHISETLQEELADKEKPKEQDLSFTALLQLVKLFPSEVSSGRKTPFTSVADVAYEIDLIRTRVTMALTQTIASRGHLAELQKPRYLWFPKNDLGCYQIRDGNAPSDFKRPGYLKGHKLHIDPLNWPRRIVDLLKIFGVVIDFEREKLQELIDEQKRAAAEDGI